MHRKHRDTLSRETRPETRQETCCAPSRDASADVLSSQRARTIGVLALFLCTACAHRWPRFTRIAARRAGLRTLVGSTCMGGRVQRVTALDICISCMYALTHTACAHKRRFCAFARGRTCRDVWLRIEAEKSL